MKWGKWLSTASLNSATPPDGWPEGQLPSTVNDCAREMMAQIKVGISNVQFIDLDFSPTQTGNTTFTVPGNQASVFHYGRRIQASDATTLYGTVISSMFTTNTGVTLRMDSGALGGSLSAVAIGFPTQTNTSLPENVYRRKNILINGQLDIWQRTSGAAFGAGLSGRYIADRWAVISNISVGAVNVSRLERSASAVHAPTLAQAGVFITNSIGFSVSAVDSGLAGTEFLYLTQIVEGYNWRQMAHKPMSLSFWANSNKTGTYCVSFTNAGANNSYIAEYTISAASTWEKKTIAIPEAPTTGTWDYSSGTGLEVHLILAAGIGRTMSAGVWSASSGLATSSQTNFLSSAGNVIKFTGFQLEEGTQATPLEPVNYLDELNRCLRYYQEIPATSTNGAIAYLGFATTTVNAQFMKEFPAMRAQPTVTYPPVANVAIGRADGSTFGCSAISTTRLTPTSLTIAAVQVAGGNLTLGLGAWLGMGFPIALDAEL